MVNIGGRIKALRKLLGLSQKEFAQKMGLPQQNINRWEKGIVYPNVDNLFKMCKIFGVSMDWLIAGEGVPIKKMRYIPLKIKEKFFEEKKLPFHFYLKEIIESEPALSEEIIKRIEKTGRDLKKSFSGKNILEDMLEGNIVEPFVYDIVLEVLGFESWEDFLYKTDFKYFLPVKYIPVVDTFSTGFPLLCEVSHIESYIPVLVNFPAVSGFRIPYSIPELDILKRDILFINGKENIWESGDIVLLKFEYKKKIIFKIKRILEKGSFVILFPFENGEDYIFEHKKLNQKKLKIYRVSGVYRSFNR